MKSDIDRKSCSPLIQRNVFSQAYLSRKLVINFLEKANFVSDESSLIVLRIQD